MRALWSLLSRNRDFRRLLAAGQISLLGDWMLHIGIAYYVFDLTGSTLASAGTLLAAFLPSILLSSVAGVFVDRWDRKTTMIAANVLLAVGLLPLLLVNDPDHVWIVYAVTAYEGIVERFFIPAEQAMVPKLVTAEDRPTANALNGQIREIARLVGSAVGGVAVAAGGITLLAIADALTFIVAAVLVAGIRADGRAEPADAEPAGAQPQQHLGDAAFGEADPALFANAGPASKLGALVHEWAAGLRIAVSRRELRVVFLFSLLAMTGEGVMGTMFVPFVRNVLHGSGQEYGLVVAVQAIGGIVGGVVAASLGQRLSAAAMFGFGAVLFGFVDLVMFLYPLVYVAIWPAVACMILVGVPGAVTMTGYNTLLQGSTTDAFRGRVFGALGVVQGVGIVTGTLSAGLLGERFDVVPIIMFQGIFGMIGGVVVLTVLRRHLRDGPAKSARGTDSATAMETS